MEQTALLVDLFHGPVTSTEATIYAQIAKPTPDVKWKLRGQLRGPTNLRAETLPATLKFTDAGPGDSVLAKVRVPDPCSWSMDLPALYHVELELLKDNQPSQRWQGTTGFRDFGPAGKSFSLNGERWVVRGKSLPSDADLDIGAWREQRLVCFCESPSESLLRTASEQGAPLFVRLPQNDITQELRRVAAWPAALGVVLPSVTEIDSDLLANTNVAIGCNANAETVRKLSAIPEKERCFGFACVTTDVARAVMETNEKTLPLIVVSETTGDRSEIDRLQASLTPGNFAGYVLG